MLLQFEACISRINTFLKLIGMSIDDDDSDKTMLERLKKHWICLIHLIEFNFANTCQSLWVLHAIGAGATLWEITFELPCLTLCLLGDFKLICFIRDVHYVNDLVHLLRILQTKIPELGNEKVGEAKKWIAFLATISNILLMLTIVAVLAFGLGPFVIMASHYYSTGEVKLFLPFLLWYPFDPHDIKFWPFAYIQQMWAAIGFILTITIVCGSAWVAVFSVYAPDCFFYTCCTFIHIQFLVLQHEIERIVKDTRTQSDYTTDTFKAEFVQLVNLHRDLMRCVNLLEIIYSKSNLFNVVTSSLIICATGFNLMAIDNIALMAPFTSFLIFALLQSFLYCFYGDHLMRSSMGVGDALYNSHWYETGMAERKYLLIVLVRSQKPCKVTAYGFTDINLTAFTRILSTSWSYFALLKRMYN